MATNPRKRPRKTYASGRKEHQKSKLKYCATIAGPRSVCGVVQIQCCTSEAMAQALNCCAESPVGSSITQFDVRDYFNRPDRTQQISLKFDGIQLCRVQSDKSYAANEK